MDDRINGTGFSSLDYGLWLFTRMVSEGNFATEVLLTN